MSSAQIRSFFDPATCTVTHVLADAAPRRAAAIDSVLDYDLDVFIGDTLFMPDYGSARCDFPGGDAATLHASVRRLLALPELLLPSIQVNVRAGRLPPPEANGRCYLKIPLNVL